MTNPFRDAMRYQENKAKRSKGYHLVLVKHSGIWEIHFGDYDKAVARDEYHSLDLTIANKALVTSPSDEQFVLDAIVKAWNMKR